MKCRFCDEEIKLGPCCDRCQQLYLLILDMKPSVVEKIIREISVKNFMKETVKK